MDRSNKAGKAFRRIALALACIMAVCVFAPAMVSAKTTEQGLVSEQQLQDAKGTPTLGVSSFTYAVGAKDTIYYTKNGQKLSATFKSGNTKIFTITKAGKLTAKSPGTAAIYCYRNGNLVLQSTVTVKKNIINISLSGSGINTGYTGYTQSGNGENPTVCVKLKKVQYTATKKLKLTYQMYNFSSTNWSRVAQLKYIKAVTPGGTTLADISTINLNSPFYIRGGQTLNFTLILSGKQVKKWTDLTSLSGMSWNLRWYPAGNSYY